MSSKVDTTPTPEEASGRSPAASGKTDETGNEKLIVAVVSAVLGGIAALLVAWATGYYTMASAERTGAYLLRNSENEFLREQRIAAYGDYIEDLLTLEQKYRTAADLMKPPGAPAQKQASESVEGATAVDQALTLIDELEVAMNDITQAKSVVDVLGPSAVEKAGETAINCYGPLKGHMQYNLLEWSKPDGGTPAAKPTDEEALRRMQEIGREPFTIEARKSLDTPDIIANTAEATPSATAGAQSTPVADPAQVCMYE